eukprot:CAMPEP_0117580624 /NCGR_PEP_ID=MMETSP0784-20121206/65322_1 /TAXON_ID=39447 /ORGANISM="" /LENGTH=154 /DNA_ID=CAMNT_0005380739 /DNA_START=19 /DNA_END=480 /DNA_ORIENTATION=-
MEQNLRPGKVTDAYPLNAKGVALASLRRMSPHRRDGTTLPPQCGCVTAAETGEAERGDGAERNKGAEEALRRLGGAAGVARTLGKTLLASADHERREYVGEGAAAKVPGWRPQPAEAWPETPQLAPALAQKDGSRSREQRKASDGAQHVEAQPS